MITFSFADHWARELKKIFNDFFMKFSYKKFLKIFSWKFLSLKNFLFKFLRRYLGRLYVWVHPSKIPTYSTRRVALGQQTVAFHRRRTTRDKDTDGAAPALERKRIFKYLLRRSEKTQLLIKELNNFNLTTFFKFWPFQSFFRLLFFEFY